MKTVDEIITAVGGPERACMICGVARATLRHYRRAGRFSARHETALIRMSGGRLTVDDFGPEQPQVPESEAAA